MPDNSEKREGGQLWIAVGDIHDDTGGFERIPELDQADGLIITGDLTMTGGARQAEKVMEALNRRNLPVLAQIGNMDRPEVDAWLSKKGCNLHGAALELTPEVAIFGAGGSTFTPSGTPSEFPESDFAGWLEKAWRKARAYPATILISHNPPKDTICDQINPTLHVGSTAVREFIEECQPDVCICGHIHEGVGVDHIGRTVIINPGPLAQGGYVLLRVEGPKVTAELRSIPDEA